MSNNKLIKQLEKIPCYYHAFSHCVNANNPKCIPYCQTILECKINITEDLIIKFLTFVTPCLPFGSEEMISVIDLFLKKYPNNKIIFESVCPYYQYDIFFKKYNIELNDKIIDELITRFSKACNKSNDMVDYLFEKIEMNIVNIERLCYCSNEYLAYRLSLVIDKFEGELNSALLHGAYIHYPDSRCLVNSLRNRGLKFDDECLKNICIYCNACALNSVLDEEGIIPNNEHFGYIFHSLNKSDIVDKIIVLLKYGYKYTPDDVLASLEHKINLPHFDKSNIVFDQKMLDLCSNNNFYPEYQFEPYDKLALLRTLCKTLKAKAIRDLLSKYDIVPDEECMINACSRSSNMTIVKLLINAGGIITLECLKRAAFCAPSRCFVHLLFNEYGGQIELYKKHIEKLQEQVVALGGIPVVCENDNNKPNIIKFHFDQDEIEQCKKQYEQKQLMSLKYNQIFGTKRSCKKTFNDLKKTIEERKKWISKDNAGFLNLPDQVRNVLGLEDGLVNVDDIDKLVCLILKSPNDDVKEEPLVDS